MYDIAINLAAHIADINMYESSLPHTSESSPVTLFEFSLNDMNFWKPSAKVYKPISSLKWSYRMSKLEY